MAKPRKHKTEDQKADNSEAVVKHQKLCLAIDLEKRRIYGFSLLKEHSAYCFYPDETTNVVVTNDEQLVFICKWCFFDH
ncbi:hypothetical protein HanLR1_Chr05g0186501 [Helianthus annuus]|nr:hypothetical protein HanLR1_Chr05g0186501 [Helianthus annuus]